MKIPPVLLKRRALILTVTLLSNACTVGPDYHRPSSAESSTFKELHGWKQAQPSDHLLPSQWWTLFNDAYLNSLVAQVQLNNQSLAQAEAQFR